MQTSKISQNIFQYLELVTSLTKSNMKSRYRKTIAGFLWVILNPILTFTVQALIFKNILRVNVSNYYLFLLSGVVPWIFLTSTLNMTVSSFVVNRPVFMAFKIDPRIFILSQSIDNLITFIASFSVLLFINSDLSIFLYWKIPMFLLSIGLICFATFFLSFLLAILHVFMRDTQFILQFILNLAYFITPIFYPKELIPERLQWVVSFNPLFIIIKPFQSIFWKYDLHLFALDFFRALVLTTILILACAIYWRRKKNEIYFRL